MKAIVNFIGEILDVGLIDPKTRSRVILINAVIKIVFGRNNYRAERFIIEVTLPWNGLKRTIDNIVSFMKLGICTSEEVY